MSYHKHQSKVQLNLMSLSLFSFFSFYTHGFKHLNYLESPKVAKSINSALHLNSRKHLTKYIPSMCDAHLFLYLYIFFCKALKIIFRIFFFRYICNNVILENPYLAAAQILYQCLSKAVRLGTLIRCVQFASP